MQPINTSWMQSIDTHLLDANQNPQQMLQRHIQVRKEQINRQDREEWSHIQNRSEWETFVKPRIDALKASLGAYPKPPENLNIHISGIVEGEGYRIQNLVFESRPGIFVSANLYCPEQIGDSIPSILLVHSHHNPKVQGELQDMGILWARLGCRVLVMDQFAYGDRRQHNPGSRQDYYFRYMTSLQLATIGDSLMGWMVWDIHRGIDLLLLQPNADPEKVTIMGSVAGGGDPAAVAAALDDRITCAVPFNFGGPQPETPYPLPDDAEETFNYMGSGGWESTRNLRLSARDGFLPWVIVGSIAPRRLIYAHEFSWDQERDPVWKRLQQIYSWYDAEDHLDYTLGFGLLKGRPPHASHCNNIGVPHRQRIYDALNRWFDIPPPEQEIEERHPEEKLQSLTPDLKETLRPPQIHNVFAQIAKERHPQNLSKNDLRANWATLLGDIEPAQDPAITFTETQQTSDHKISRFVLEPEPGISIPSLILHPNTDQKAIVIAISQADKSTFITERTDEISELLNAGIAICLPDIRGTGETAPDGSRIPRSSASAVSASEQMHSQTMLGARLKDLRSIIFYIRSTHPNSTIALWGDSFAPTNPTDFTDPLMGEDAPHFAEPLGGLLALFGALFENDIKAVIARGTFPEYSAILKDTYCYMPHDVIVPGAIAAGNLSAIATALPSTALRLDNLIDGRNCPLSHEVAQDIFASAQTAYHLADTPFAIESSEKTVSWLIHTLDS